MSFSIAGLTFSVDSSQAVQSAADLNTLSDASDRTTRSHDQLILSHERFIAASRDLSVTLAEERRQFQQTQDTLANSILTLQQYRDAALAATAATTGFTQARAQVEALGQAYSQSSAGIELFQQRSAALALSSGETVVALQRITDAINNNSPSGTATRGVLSQLGINVGSDPNQADQVLQQFYQKLQGLQDGAGKFRTVESVLGPLAPQDYQTFTAPTYDTISEQRQRERSTANARYVADTTRSSDIINQQTGLDRAAYTDASSRYDLGYLSQDQLAELARRSGTSVDDLQTNLLGRASPFFFGENGPLSFLTSSFNSGSLSARLPAYSYLRNNPNDPLAQAATGPLSGIGDFFRGSYLGRLANYTFSDRQQADILNEQAGFGQNRDRDGLLPAIGQLLADDFRITFGAPGSSLAYKPYTATDTRSVAPLASSLSDPVVASQLAGFGFDDVNNLQALTGLQRQLNEPQTQKLFEGAYGSDIGDQLLAQRQGYNTSELSRVRLPGSSLILDAQRQRYLAGLSPDQAPAIQQLLQFIQGAGIKTDLSQLYNSGTGDLTQAENLLLTGGDRGQRDDFNRFRNISFEAGTASASLDAQVQIDQQRQFATAAQGGSAALEDMRAKIEAVTAATKENRDTTTAAAEAEEKLRATRDTQFSQTIGNQTILNSQRGGELSAETAAGVDPFARAAALRQAQFGAQVTNEQGFAPGTTLTAAEQAARTQRLGQLQEQGSQEALLSLADSVTQASRGLLGSTAGAKAAGLSQTDAALTGQLGDTFSKLTLTVPGVAQSFATLAEQLVKVSQGVATLNAEAQNFGTARDLRFQTQQTQLLASLPPSQRPLAERQLSIAAPQIGTNPVFGPRSVNGDLLPTLDPVTQQQIRASAAAQGVDPDFAVSIATNEGAGPNSTNPFQVLPSNQSSFAKTAQGFGLDANPNTRAGEINIGVAGLLQAKQQIAAAYPNNPEFNTPAAQAAVNNRGLNGPGVRAFIESGGTNASGLDAVAQQYVANIQGPSPSDVLRIGQNDPALASAFNQQGAQLTAQARFQDQTAQEGVAARTAPFQTTLGLLATGQTGAARLSEQNYLDPSIADQQSQADDRARRLAQTQRDLEQAFASSTGEITKQTQASNTLAQAYGQGDEAVAQAKIQIQANTDALTDHLNAQQKAQDVIKLTAAEVAKEGEAFAALKLQTDQKISSDQFNVSLGVQPPDQIAAQVSAFNAKQTAVSLYPENPTAQSGYIDQQSQQLQYQQQVEGLNNVRDAAKEMGDTLFNGFSRALQGGESFKRFVGDLFTEIGTLVEKTLLEKPLENLLSSTAGSIFGATGASPADVAALGNGSWFNGPLNSIFGGSGGGDSWSGSGVGVGNIIPSGSGGGGGFFSSIFGGGGGDDPFAGAGEAVDGFAKGGAFPGGIRFHATGSILNTPQAFQTPDGALNVAGEAGPEAILPLRVMPNGSLGVAGPGGAMGGGGSITIHAPVTIQSNGNGQGNGLPDQQSMEAFQRHMQGLIRDAVNQQILVQQRPGGSMFNYGQQAA